MQPLVDSNCPTRHARQASWPASGWYLPGLQRAHTATAVDRYFPGAHFSHGPWFWCRALCPTGHAMQCACLNKDWNFPAGHAWQRTVHTGGNTSTTLLLNRPIAQGLHFPLVSECPSWHRSTRQAEAEVRSANTVDRPCGQTGHEVESVVSGRNLPTGQAAHRIAPAAAPKRPVGQNAHLCVFAGTEYLPAGQIVHGSPTFAAQPAGHWNDGRRPTTATAYSQRAALPPISQRTSHTRYRPFLNKIRGKRKTENLSVFSVLCSFFLLLLCASRFFY